VAGRRAFVVFARSREISASRACQLVKVSRRRLAYESRKDEGELLAELKDLAAANPRYGWRRLWAMLRRQGRVVNHKRVRRLCREHGLLLKQKRRRKRRGIGVSVPCRAEYPNHVWAYDFVEDRTEAGRKLRVLTVADEFTRQCLTVEVEYRMNARYVAQTLLRLFAERGTPKFVRSDNGPEFIARPLMRVLATEGVEARHIDPGSPWQNGRNERFNGSLRDECLNLETFHNRDHARALIKLYGRHYNERRPHSALGYQTPAEFAAAWQAPDVQDSGGCAAGGDRCSPPEDSGVQPLSSGGGDGQR
jgi:putative transposase